MKKIVDIQKIVDKITYFVYDHSDGVASTVILLSIVFLLLCC